MRVTQKRTLFMGLLLSASMVLMGVAAAGGPSLLTTQEDYESGSWTVFVYLCGDNNLEEYAIDDLVEMESVGSKNDVKIIVLLDTETIAGGEAHWLVIEEGVSHYDAETDTVNCDCDLFPDDECLGEMDMGDGDMLTWAVVTAFTYAPAENYMLVLWDHGGGWRGVCYDDSHPAEGTDGWVSRLTTPETAASLAAAQEQLRETVDEDYKLTILGYDACLNGMIEVVYENRYVADYMFASINLVPLEGMGYEGFLTVMTQDDKPTIEEIGEAIVDSYVDFYENQKSVTGDGLEYLGDVTLSFFKLGDRVTELVEDIDALAHELIEGGYLDDSSYRGAIESAESQTPRIPTYAGEQLPFIDLGLYAELLGEKIPELYTLTEKIVKGVDEVVVYENHVTAAGGGILRTTGISIYFTCSYHWINPAYWFEDIGDAELYGQNTLYYGMAFTVDTWWDEMVFTFTQAYDETVIDFE
ncbi:MAG: clostripain-related cysteine peptidase [Thermoplasmata archaeon]